MTRTLPDRPSLEQLKNQAKDLLAAYRAGDEAARRRFQEHLPHSTQSAAGQERAYRLSDAQLVLAREYGFASWPQLKAHVEVAANTPSIDANASTRQAIKTARWIETSHHYGKYPHSSISNYWVRLDPPVMAWINQFLPGPHANKTEWSHSIQDQRGDWHTVSTWDHCDLLTDTRHSPTSESIVKRILAPPMTQSEEAANPSRRFQAGEKWRSELVEQNGQMLLRMERAFVRGNFRIEQRLLADPETRRLIHHERRQVDIATGQPTLYDISDQYTYNPDVPAGVFEMPPDKPIRIRDMRSLAQDVAPEVWDSLSAQQQQALQATIDRSDAAWQKGDFQEFASVWKFDFVKKAPPKADWQARVENQVGLWRRWESQVLSAKVQRYIPVSIASNAFSWGNEKPKVLAVEVKLNVTWTEDGDTWEGNAEFFLRRIGRGFRIVHWECPWEEIKAVHQGEREPTQA